MKKSTCAAVFVHGFMGFGEQDGIYKYVPYWGWLGKNTDAMTHLREKGYEVYAPSVGPVNSAWDRAVDTYYQIVGGTVDYGKVHSEKYGHKRFGRTYPGLIPDLGQPGAHEKIDLIGHSFGAPTVRVLAELLPNGCQEEIEGTPAEELSELYKGGHHCIRSVTTLAGVNNGTTLASFLRERGVLAINDLYLGVNTMFGNSIFADKLIDFHMDQWGVNDDPAAREKTKIRSPFARWKNIQRFDENVRDSVGFEMQIEGMYDMNQSIHCAPDIYYFAHPSGNSHSTSCDIEVMNRDASILAKVVGLITGSYHNTTLQRYGYSRPAWDSQDGFVNTECAKAPYNEPQADYAEGVELEPGKWYNMPVERLSHVSYMGMDMKKGPFFEYYDNLMEFLEKLPG